MVTMLPPNNGGYITSSFSPNETAKANIYKIFAQSSTVRASQVGKHNQYVGYYGVTQKTDKSFRITPMLLPLLGVDDSAGSEVNVFATTLSNSATDGRAVLVPYDDMIGSTIRLVSHEFAKTLPPKIPKGKPFLNTVTKLAPIKDLLPADSNTTKYVLVLCPNTLGIPAGETETNKGTLDDNMAEHFRDLGKHAIAWANMVTDMAEGVLPFEPELQTLAVTHKADFGTHFPKYTSAITLTTSQAMHFSTPPAVEDDDDAITATIQELRAQMKAAALRNMAAASPADPIGINVDMADMDSVIGLGAKPATSATNTDRQQAKLRLLCASYCETTGVTLFDLRDEITDVLADRKENQAESISNQLAATSNGLALTMDAINRAANWPLAYADTP